MSDEATNVLRQALAATQSTDADQRKQGEYDPQNRRCNEQQQQQRNVVCLETKLLRARPKTAFSLHQPSFGSACCNVVTDGAVLAPRYLGGLQ